MDILKKTESEKKDIRKKKNKDRQIDKIHLTFKKFWKERKSPPVPSVAEQDTGTFEENQDF